MHEETSLLKIILESNLLNFIVATGLVVFLFQKFVPKSVQNRKQELEQEIAKATQAKQEAEAKLQELEQEIDRAKAESLQIASQAQDTAKSIKQQILDDTAAEVDRMNANALRDIEQHRVQTIEALRQEIARAAIAETERVLKDKREEIDSLIQAKVKKDIASIK